MLGVNISARKETFTLKLHLLPVFILIVVACTQMTLSSTHDLSPWKGGGFGMFSTVDFPSSRKLKVYFIGENNEKVRVPRKIYRKMEKRFRTLPTKKRFDRLALYLKQIVPLKMPKAQKAEFLVVQFWRYKYSAERGQLEKRLVFPKKMRLKK